MSNKTVYNIRDINGDYFRIGFARDVTNNVMHYADQIKFDDYWCFKMTHYQKLASYEEFIEFKHSGYTFFKKDLFPLNRITEWLEWMREYAGGLQYLAKPTPPFNPQKVKILK
jgi:hypothetical protein